MKKLILLFAMIVAMSAEASAQQNAELFEQGAKQYLAGNYEDAIVSWQKAYAMQPAAILLYNIALASGKLKNHTQAIAFATRAESDRNQPLDERTTLKNAAHRQAWQMTVRSTRAAERIQRDLQVVAGKKPLGWMAWTGISSAVLGAGALGTSVFFALDVEDGIEKARATTDPDEHASLRTKTQRNQILGQVFLYSGIGLLAVGTTLFILDRTIETGSETALYFSGHSVGVKGNF